MSAQININSAFEQDLLEIKATYPKDILILDPCLHHNPMNNTIRCVEDHVYKYPEILQVIFISTSIINVIYKSFSQKVLVINLMNQFFK